MGMNELEEEVLPSTMATTTNTGTCLAEPHLEASEDSNSSDSDASYTPPCTPPSTTRGRASSFTAPHNVPRGRGRRIRRCPRIRQTRDHTPEPLEASKRNLSVFKQCEEVFIRLFAREIVDRKWLLTREVLCNAQALADEMEKEGHIWCKVGMVRNDAIASGTHKHQEAYQQLSYPVCNFLYFALTSKVVAIPRGFAAKGRRKSSWTFTCTLGGRCLHSPCHSDIPSAADTRKRAKESSSICEDPSTPIDDATTPPPAKVRKLSSSMKSRSTNTFVNELSTEKDNIAEHVNNVILQPSTPPTSTPMTIPLSALPARPTSPINVEVRDITTGQSLQATADPRRKLSELAIDLYKITGIGLTTMYNNAGRNLSCDTTVGEAGSLILTNLCYYQNQVPQPQPQSQFLAPPPPRVCSPQSYCQPKSEPGINPDSELEFSQYEDEFKRGIWDDRDVDMFA